MTFRIREARAMANFTQEELANRLGIKDATLSGYETGKHDPKSDTLIEIARICGVTTDYLLGLETASPAESLSLEAYSMAQKYDLLDNVGKTVLDAVADIELRRMRSMNEEIDRRVAERAAQIEAAHRTEGKEEA